ncbi:MAG: hypothetical protein HC888_19460 [Candidatus Competibacteraceae bacterium]|nr:hypothetical protein [Candidatus Competibacteraceae bacterium]
MSKQVQHAMCGMALLASAASALAQPATINLHGAVASPEGVPLAGSRAYFVQFYDAASGGSALGAAYTGNVTVSPSGVFNLPLTPPPGIFTAAEVWYELGIDTDDPVDNSAADDIFNGRIQVQSVPFALQAAEAAHVDVANVGDGSISQAELGTLDGISSSIQAQLNLLEHRRGRHRYCSRRTQYGAGRAGRGHCAEGGHRRCL